MKKILTLFALLIAFAVNGFATTYTVAGSNTTLFGVSWDPTETANDMTLSPTATNIYEWSKENVTLDGGNIEFKVCENHAWANAHPGSNWVINSTTGDYSNGAGVYDVTITFNSDAEEINVTITYKGSAVIPNATIETVQLLGDWNWNTAVDNITLTKGEGNVWTGTLDLSSSALDQTFKLVVNGGGDESDGWKGWIGTNNLAISNTTPTGWVLATAESANANCTFYNSKTGYKTYNVEATWTPNADYAAQWTLTIAGKDRRDYYVIGGNGEVWTVLGKMNYYEPMDEYDYVMDKSTSTFTGKYFAIAPESALNAAKDGVEDWSKVVRPVTTSGNFLVEMINYFEIKATSGSNINQVWELADDITEVVISYYISDNEFVLYPVSVVEITSAGYATYSNKDPYQIVGADVEVSIVKEVTTTEAVMNKLDIYTDLGESEIVKNIPAGTGVIVKGTGIFYVQPYGTNNHKDYVDVTGNMLIGSNNDTYNITGTYPAELGSGKYTAYVLKEINSKVGFYKVNDTDRNLAAHKAFLAVPTTSSGAPEFILIGGGDGTTGINATLRDNVNDNAIFDLSGRRVVNPTKGIYIVNGRKVVIK